MITGIAHINLLVPVGTLEYAEEFYGKTLGLSNRPVPKMQKDSLRWFDIGESGQQVHVALGSNETKSSRHPCFRVGSKELLSELQQRIYEHYEKGGDAAPTEADRPGEQNSGAAGVEYPTRFFARDYAGNRLEFSL